MSASTYRILLASLVVLLVACKPLPKERLYQFTLSRDYQLYEDSLHISLENPLHAPIRSWLKATDTLLQRELSAISPLTLPPLTDTSFTIYFSSPIDTSNRIRFASSLGAPGDSLIVPTLRYPFVKGRTYKIIQGYNGTFSHNSDFSKYAVDFNLAIGDTVCAAAAGYVVGVIEGYRYGGKNRKWRDYANFITLYHPDGGFLTQYVHLKHEGSLVEIGDHVDALQPIGLSGLTGFTTVAHLHFNVLVPTETTTVSSPAIFENGIAGSKLRRGVRVRHAGEEEGNDESERSYSE